MTRPALRLPFHRGTTAHVSSVYPFSVQRSLGYRGSYVGIDLLAGGAEFCWDPFEAYNAGIATNPNVWVLGEPGNGKSALVKSLLWRQAATYGEPGTRRWLSIADPKGEYATLAELLGLKTIKLVPGGSTRINPLAYGPHRVPERAGHSREPADMCASLLATVLRRELTQFEDALLFAAVSDAMSEASRAEPTLIDVARLLSDPTESMGTSLRRTPSELPTESSTIIYALDKLLSRSLRGMFDGPSTVGPLWDGPGLVLDLSAVPLDSEALPLVMTAAAGWLQQLISAPGPQRIQVIDEAWALLRSHHTASYLQRCAKLGRAFGVANICITHRASDLAAQADDGTAIAKIAGGLLADAATRVILRQAPDQLEAARTHFGLSRPEADIVGQLTRGRALWKISDQVAVVQHTVCPREVELCDTDGRMQ